MSRNVRVLHCTPEDVFEVLSDGWLYPSWVVGASRMREVDETWPMAGAELHHSFGVWPALIDDKTVVEEFIPSRMMVMRARGWPIGEARVTLDVKTRGDDCVVRIQEEAIAGPGRFIPAQLLDIPLHWRNDETLHRLAYLAEGRAADRREATTAEKEMADTGEEHHTDAGAPGAAGATASIDPTDAAKLQGDELADAVSGSGGTEDAMAGKATGSEPAPVTSTDGVEQADATGRPLDLEDSWNPLAGAGESEPLAADTPDPGGAAADAASDTAPKPPRNGVEPTGAKPAGSKPAGAQPTGGQPAGSEAAGTEAPSP
ncbi:SRPBCC family protein [Microbacterium sp. B35-30]|uniref:SRPBCC family protein n=1 Tax=unclassified Microbacterium TaxID=2609290 RepID=UPI0031F31EEA